MVGRSRGEDGMIVSRSWGEDVVMMVGRSRGEDVIMVGAFLS
jgi:hypothetical protein